MPKISALTPDATVTGTEVFPIVQGGVTKQATIEQMTQSRDSFCAWHNQSNKSITNNMIFSGYANYSAPLKTSPNFNATTGIYTASRDIRMMFTYIGEFSTTDRIGDFIMRRLRSGTEIWTSIWAVWNPSLATWNDTITLNAILPLQAGDQVYVDTLNVSGTVVTHARYQFMGFEV